MPPHEQGEPVYDVKNATGVYAGMAGTLSGFAFTAIVLLLTEFPTNCAADPHCPYLRQRALMALVIAFIGCGISGFAFGVVAAVGDHRRRLRAAFFAGNGFIVALAHLLWAVAVLAKLFLMRTGGATEVSVTLGVSLGTIGTYMVAPLFLLLAARAFEYSWLQEQAVRLRRQSAKEAREHKQQASESRGRPKGSTDGPVKLSWSPRVRLCWFGMVPILLVVAVVYWVLEGSLLTHWTPEAFDRLSLASGIFVVAMVASTLLSVTRKPKLDSFLASKGDRAASVSSASSVGGLAWLPVVLMGLLLSVLILVLPK